MSILGTVREQFQRGPGGATDIDLDEAFELLRNSRRRHVVEYVADLQSDETVRLRELAIYIAALEFDQEPDAVSRAHIKSVRNALYQSHLAKLAEADVIEYDERAGTVGRGSTIELLADLISTARQVFDEDGGWR